MHEFLHTFRSRVSAATDLCVQYLSYPGHCLQWCSRHLLVWMLLVFALVGIPALHLSGAMNIETVNQLGRYLCFAIVALSLDLLWGYGGMLCLCQFLFFAIGGYAMGMYLAHHGGPEGIIDANNWGKIPACLFVVYPGGVGQTQAEWTVPFFWKPFWNLWSTLILGLLVPGCVAGLIGFSLFRSRVRGVFFAIVTQAIVLASLNVFNMNEMKAGGTNGLTRFDRVVFGSRECLDIRLRPDRAKEYQLDAETLHVSLMSAQTQINNIYREQVTERQALARQSKFVSGSVADDPTVTRLTGAHGQFTLSLSRSLHAWQIRDLVRSLPVLAQTTEQVVLSDIADISLAGYRLTDSKVRLTLYLITAITLVVIYCLCRLLVNSRLGRVLIAIRDNENRLRFAGFKPWVFKTFVFAVSGMIAGLAGMLYAPQQGIITPTSLEPTASILVVVWVAVGGRGSLQGPVAGALAVNYLYSYLTSSSPDAWPFVLGILFVAVTVFLPNGLMGVWQEWLSLSLRPASTAVAGTSQGVAQLPRTNRSLVAAGFGLISAFIAAWIAWSLFRAGGPIGNGLMATRAGVEIVIGLLYVLTSFSAAIWACSGIGILMAKRGSLELTNSMMKAVLAFSVAAGIWCFFRHTFANQGETFGRRLRAWANDGGSQFGMLIQGNVATSVSVIVSMIGIGICWWVMGGRWAALRSALLSSVGQYLPGSPGDSSDRLTTVGIPVDAFREPFVDVDRLAELPTQQPDDTQPASARNAVKNADAIANGDLLHVDGVKAFFDGFKALDIEEFRLQQNELHVIIGPNGAGKTTLCDVISGKTRADEGRVFFAGDEITRRSEPEISRLGIGRKFQTPTVFDSLSVDENMQLVLPNRHLLMKNFGRQAESAERDRIDTLLNRVGLFTEREKAVGYLSHGQRQWLEISMLILSSPQLLLIDEPAAGLTDEETRTTADLLLELRESHSVIVIEHDMDFVRRLDSPVTVLHEGMILRQGFMNEIENDSDVREAYLGR